MKKHLLLLFLLLIFFRDVFSEECSDFDEKLQTACQGLSIQGERFCYFSKNQCHEWYKDCTDYNPQDNNVFDDNICEKIIPLETKHKCKVVEYADGTKKCEFALRKCSEYIKKEDCIYLEAETDKRCVWVDNKKCEEHFNSCDNNDLHRDETKCKNNIPKNDNKKYKCVWKKNELTDKCQSEVRKCEDFINYSDNTDSTSGDDSTVCTNLVAGTYLNSKCLLNDNNECIEVFENCDHGTDRKKCEKTILYDNNGIDHLYKCVYIENEEKDINSESTFTCTQKKRVCEDYKKREDDKEVYCWLFSDYNSNYKKCFLDGNKCEEVYYSCEDYNNVSPIEIKEDICKSIIPKLEYNKIDQHKKCSYGDDHLCHTKIKECNEIDSEDICINHIGTNSKKKCIFKNNKCIEDYINCQSYNEEITEENRKKADCETITPWKDENNNLNKCIFSLEENKCISKEIKCEGDNKKDCESIVFYNDPYQRCFFEKDTTCEKKTKLCSEYLEKNETECKKYRASDDENKICAIENGKCVEKYREPTYKYCSDYRGNDKSICESIQPYQLKEDSNPDLDNLPDYYSKCVFVEERLSCERLSIGCEKAKNSKECYEIKPDNTNMTCIFINNECIEQYKTCQKYEENVDRVDEDYCKSIVYEEKQKCKYILDNDKGKCIPEARDCSDFKIESIVSQCSEIVPSDETKKCLFKDNQCSSFDRTCLELVTLSGENDEIEKICEAAETSSEKKCIPKTDANGKHTGCEEISESEYEERIQTKAKDKNNSARIQYLNKMLLLFFCLLI